jgi:Anti-sigma-K factor rskA, C-terminal
MTSVSETPVVAVHPRAEDVDAFGPTFAALKRVDVPQPRRPSPTPLVVLGLLAGIAAMVLGGVAVFSAVRSADEPAAPVGPAQPMTTPRVEQQILALLAKPSTERVMFRGSGGRLVLVVGSAGRAAILVRGFAGAPAGRPYRAWIVGSGKPMRAATLTGTERAVFLSAPVLRGESVVVASSRSAAARPKAAGIVAARG